METNPLVPRQRNRRADRQSPQEQAAPQPPVQQPVPPRPQQPVYPPQQAYPQSPRTMYQQPVQQAAPVPPPAQPVQTARPTSSRYSGYSAPHTGYQQPQTPVRPVQQPSQPPVQYTPRPQVLERRTAANSGWQQPTIREPLDNPHARSGRSLNRQIAKENKAALQEAEAKASREKQEKPEIPTPHQKLPGWLTTAMTLAFLGVLALLAAYWLMNAYLVTEENNRIAAYEAILSNYHVTERADGRLTVTHQQYIEKYAAQYNLQPAFVAAIIRNESSFRTNAESSVGARGLMQLMPDTAEWIAGKLDDDSYHFDRMWDAETNIRYGCWYLGYLSRLFHGDADLVSAAYHAGQTTVTQWLSDSDKSADGVTLNVSKLSDGPTKQYIGRVTQTYGIYQSLLYPDEAFGAARSVSAGSSADAASDR